MKKPTKKTVDRWAAHDGVMLKKGAEIDTIDSRSCLFARYEPNGEP